MNDQERPPIRWGVRLPCQHWAHGTAQSPAALPAPGDPAHCETCADWFPVVERVDTLPLQDHHGRA